MLKIKKNTAFDIADEYITHEDERVVVEFLIETFFDNDIDIDSKELIITSITYGNRTDKETEIDINRFTNLLADKLITLSDEDFKAFAITNYDSKFTYEAYA